MRGRNALTAEVVHWWEDVTTAWRFYRKSRAYRAYLKKARSSIDAWAAKGRP